ncbi:DUF488 domain-containing protein [Desulforegula conservatrix]|uniref:DUF488 domain-containing protein n=1 Tax=Desulforegula conservatrix TaxID=153026 RepID=UPI0003FA8D56|nr:DUF488 domain-containing protein [Desulforegula conservatrix]
MEFYTIGYEGLSQQEFSAWLNRYGITMVIDVRQIPFSRKKGFSKNGLSDFLTEKKIGYQSINQLGTPKPIRDNLKKTGDYSLFFKEYNKYLSSVSEETDKLLDYIHQGEKIALLCFEKDPAQCHRSAIANEIMRRKEWLQVKHI